MTAKILCGGEIEPKANYKGLGAFFFQTAEKYKNRICQVQGETGTEETFSSVKTRTTRVAIALREHGLNQNEDDFILICCNNHVDNIIPLIAGLYLGAKVAPIATTLSLQATTHIVILVKPKFIFVEEDVVEKMEESLDKAGLEAKLIVLGSGRSNKNHLKFSDFLQKSSLEETFTPVQIDDCSIADLVLFSSGTSGLPKAVSIPHYALLPSCSEDCEKEAFGFYTPASTYWISSLVCLSKSFTLGAFQIKFATFDPEKCFQMIEKYKLTALLMSPSFSYSFTSFENARNYDLTSVRMFSLGGASISPTQIEKIGKLFTNTIVAVNYGSTEAYGVITCFDFPRDLNQYKNKYLRSCGKVLKGVQLKIVDTKSGKILGPNQRGEIYYKTSTPVKFYCKQDSLNNVFDADGFYKSGDIGYYDEDEWLYIVDRVKEIFKYRASQVVPSHIEAALMEHPAVYEAAVFGIPHEIDDCHPAACVSLNPSAKISVDELAKFVTTRVSDWEILRGGIKIVDEVLKTPSGKVIRKKMMECFINQ